MSWQFPSDTVYQVMTEQPDTCQKCGSRLKLLEITRIDEERVFVCQCLECPRIVPVVQDDVDALDNSRAVYPADT